MRWLKRDLWAPLFIYKESLCDPIFWPLSLSEVLSKWCEATSSAFPLQHVLMAVDLFILTFVAICINWEFPKSLNPGFFWFNCSSLNLSQPSKGTERLLIPLYLTIETRPHRYIFLWNPSLLSNTITYYSAFHISARHNSSKFSTYKESHSSSSMNMFIIL